MGGGDWCEIATASRSGLLIPDLNVWTPILGPMGIPAIIISIASSSIQIHRKAVHTNGRLLLVGVEEHAMANIAIDGH